MIESKEYKDHKNDIKDKLYDDFMYSDGFTDGYENSYETHKPYLEWQKPEDVELVDGKQYLAKNDRRYCIVRYQKEIDLFLDVDYYYSYKKEEIFIKQIEV